MLLPLALECASRGGLLGGFPSPMDGTFERPVAPSFSVLTELDAA